MEQIEVAKKSRPVFKKIKRSTVTETIIEQIKDMIEKGELKPGVRLPSERDLAELLAVSRPSVREAMKSLHSMGIVEILTGDGTYLNENTNIISDHFHVQHLLRKFSLLELIQARKVLEVEIAALAAQNATAENKENLQEIFGEILEKKDDVRAFLKADFAYHLAIAETAGNRFLAEMLNTTRDLLLESNLDVIKKAGQIDIAIKSHQSILEAIKNNDVSRARQEMLKHLDTIETAVNEIYGN